MKKICFYFSIISLFVLLLASCDEQKSDLFIGKWDLTNDSTSSLQQVLELKDNNVFIETWVVTSDDGMDTYELEIQGEYSIEEIVDNTRSNKKALCRIYNLESLSDPCGVLQFLESENVFADRNKEYYESKKRGEVYGIPGVSATPTRMYYEVEANRAGITYNETHEFPRVIDNNENKK